MTGLEALREEMIKRGCTKQQAESKAVAVVLDIVAGTGSAYSDIYSAEKKLAELRGQIDRDKEYLNDLRREYSLQQKKYIEEESCVKELIEDFNNSIADCETEEAADALRTAQFFINNVDVNTKYDNTAYIVGLAAILSGKKIDPNIELRKINTKLPETGGSLGRL